MLCSRKCTKPGRERVVPIQQSLDPVLQAWHRLCGRQSSGLVFCKADMGDSQIPLHKDDLTQAFETYVRAAGLSGTINLHGLGLSYATHLIRNGLDINEVSKILGSSSLKVTKSYEHLNPTDLQNRVREGL